MFTVKQMLAAFSAAAAHTHEAAVEALYKLGHSHGVEEVKAKLLAGDQALHDELNARHDAEVKANQVAADAQRQAPQTEQEIDAQRQAGEPLENPGERELRLHRESVLGGEPAKAPESSLESDPVSPGKLTIDTPVNETGEAREQVIEAPAPTDVAQTAPPTVGAVESDQEVHTDASGQIVKDPT